MRATHLPALATRPIADANATQFELPIGRRAEATIMNAARAVRRIDCAVRKRAAARLVRCVSR